MINEKDIGAQIAAIIQKCIELCEIELKNKVLVSRRDEEIYIVCLYSTLLVYSRSISALISKRQYISVPNLFRSVLEAFVDLKNLCEDDEYFQVLRYISLKKRQKHDHKIMENQENPFLPMKKNLDEYEVSMVIERLKSYKRELPEVENRVKKYKKEYEPSAWYDIQTRFDHADLIYIYDSMYNHSSVYIHNDLKVLAERHIDVGIEKINISTAGIYTPNDVYIFIQTLPAFLTGGLEFIFDRFKIEYGKELEQILSNVREELSVAFGIE